MRRFTQAEDAEIAVLWRRGLTLRVIGAQLGRPWSGVQHRVQVMMRRGVLEYGSRSRRPWTNHDVAELRGLWGWHSDAFVARKLGRSLNSVQVKAGRLGLKDTWKGAYCARAVGAIFGVDSKTVGLWITNGFLQGRKSEKGAGVTQRWRIEHEAIERFIATHSHQYGRHRITDDYWRRLADKAVDDLVPLAVASRILGVCDETLKRCIRRGLWRAERIPWAGGFAWMVKRSDLKSFSYFRPPTPMVYERGHLGAVRKAS